MVKVAGFIARFRWDAEKEAQDMIAKIAFIIICQPDKHIIWTMNDIVDK